jgi:hypothetical protein
MLRFEGVSRCPTALLALCYSGKSGWTTGTPVLLGRFSPTSGFSLSWLNSGELMEAALKDPSNGIFLDPIVAANDANCSLLKSRRFLPEIFPLPVVRQNLVHGERQCS